MKGIFNACFLVLYTVFFIFFLKTSTFAQTENKDENIQGILIRVDEESQSVYIRSDERMLRFTAEKSLCIYLKDKMNSSIIVFFKRSESGELIISSIQIPGDPANNELSS